MTKIYVSQDGADFYCTPHARFEDEERGAPDDTVVITSPTKVSDFDLVGAKAARAWFLGHCARHGITAVFVS